MSSFPKAGGRAGVLAVRCGRGRSAEPAHPGIGAPATAPELAAWDIDVRPDFKGLPKGSGTVAQGMDLWEAKCASCHGVFGESNQVFSPLVGGTTKDDVKTGRVARLLDPAYPGRTTLMKVATVSTLWDYINRAMPWNAPKSLKPDEVYALTAYLLNLGERAARRTSRSATPTSPQVQIDAAQPQWHDHGCMRCGRARAWATRKPDVKAVACMKDCATEATVASYLPEHRAQRARQPGRAEPQRRCAAWCRHHAPGRRADAAAPSAAAAAPDANASTVALARKLNCLTCHGIDNKIVGPGFREVSQKYASRGDAAAYLAQKIVAGGSGVWGPVPMPPQTLPTADEVKTLAQWIADGAKP